MKDYKIIEVSTKDELDMLYKDNALTIEGLAADSIPDFIKWIENLSPLDSDLTVYKISGAVMNKHYKLVGKRKYPNDLTIVSVPLEYILNVGKIIIPRFEIGGRWFNDIVDNNTGKYD